MSVQQLLRGDPSRNSMIYLTVGVLSLIKALAVRNDADRFRRELVDAAFFIGIGLVLRQYVKVKEDAKAEVYDRVPLMGSEDEAEGITSLRSILPGGVGEDEPTRRSVTDRAREIVPRG